MKKNLTHGKNLFVKTLLVTAVALISATGWGTTVELGTLNLDTEYQLSFGNTYYAAFTAEEDGVLTATCTSSDILLPYVQRFETNDEMVAESNTINVVYDSFFSPKQYHFNVSAGTTYCFFNNFIMNDGTFTISTNAGSSIEIQSCTPEENSTISVSDGARISIVFNQAVSIKGATITTGNASASISANLYANTVSFELKDVLYNWLQNGTIAGGDNFTINLTGVSAASDQSILYGTDGNLSITYKMAAKPVQLVSTTNTSGTFLSYYTSENPAGIVTLTFDGEISSAAADLRFGNQEGEEGEYYVEPLEANISGNTITLNLSNKSRRPQDMVTSGTNYGNMSLRVGSVKSADGQFAYSEGQGSLGTFWFSYNNLEVVSANVISEFTPATGSSLAGVTNIEIWITDESKLSYDGIKFTYTASDGTTKDIVVTNFTKTQDPDNSDAVILNIPVPTEVAGTTNITVTLNNLTSADGIDHTNDVKAKYDSFVITSADPAKDASLEALAQGQILTVSTNMNDQIGCMIFQIRDLNPANADEAIIYSLSYFTKQDNGTFTYQIPFNMKLVKGHDYKVEITAYATEDDLNYGNAPIGEDYIIWHGAAEPFKYSTVQFVSIDPAPETTSISSLDQRVFTVTFDGLVNLNSNTTFINTGMGSSAPFESIQPVDGDSTTGETFATQWILTVSEAMIESSKPSITLSIVATDMDGRIVEGNTGNEENSYFCFVYNITIGVPDLIITPADGSEVTSLYKFIVGCPELGLNPSWTAGEIYLYNMNREQVAYVKDATPVIPEAEQDNWDYNPVEYELYLDKEITTNGSYYIIIPEGWFNLGTEFNQMNSKQTIVSYYINGEVSLDVTIDPADGSNVTSLKKFTLTFDSSAEAAPSWNGEKATLTNAQGEVVAQGEANYGDDFNIMNQVSITLDTEITADGTYTLNIPAGLFIVDNENSTAMTFTYSIGEQKPDLTIDPADGSKVQKLSVFTITFDSATEAAPSWNGEKATLTNAQGEVVTQGEANYGDDFNILNQVKITLDAEITADGTYTLNIPAGLFIVDNENSTAMTFTYYVGNSAINAILGNDIKEYKVYNLKGILVLKTDKKEALKQLSDGVYIINGKKVILKN